MLFTGIFVAVNSEDSRISLILSAPFAHIYLSEELGKLQYIRSLINEPRHDKNRLFGYAKTKTQISFAVTANLISAFVFSLHS